MLAGDFNIIFDSSLDANGGTPALESSSINKLIELNETIDLWETLKNVNTLFNKYIYLELFNAN